MSLHLSISVPNMCETETVQQKLISLCREMQQPPQLLRKFVVLFFIHTKPLSHFDILVYSLFPRMRPLRNADLNYFVLWLVMYALGLLCIY